MTDVENRYASPMKAVIGHEERIYFLEKEYNEMWQEMLSRVQKLEEKDQENILLKIRVDELEKSMISFLQEALETFRKIEDKYFIREGNK